MKDIRVDTIQKGIDAAERAVLEDLGDAGSWTVLVVAVPVSREFLADTGERGREEVRRLVKEAVERITFPGEEADR